MSATPVRWVPLGPDDIAVTRRGDGAVVLRSPHVLGPFPRNLTERLAHWAAEAPDRILAAQRDARGDWRTLTYRDAHVRARRIAQALLERGLSVERPVAILSENGIEHLLLLLAAMHVGVPCAPVSPAYSLVSTDHAKLRFIISLATPGLVFASDADRFAKAIDAAIPKSTERVLGREFAKLEATPATAQVDAAHAGTGPDTIAKFLFTSGSTGQPKAVINTQRMLCSNQQMLAQALPSLAAAPPVLVDWLPWHHTAGGNHNIGITLYNGGTLYIDGGRPLPGLIEHTVRNLREVSPTIYFNVPRGYEALLPYLRNDATLRKTFFGRLGLMQYAAAVLPQPVWKAYDELALETCGERILWITGYGATETAPFAMSTNRGAARAGTVGLPVDGLEMKLAPVNDKLEARFRGPSITPGYWRQPELTRAAFDEEDFYRTGDAMRFLDPEDPQQGLEFDGRLTEDFKLTTGTWVSVGPLRAGVIAAGAPFIQDVVITGHGRDEVGALVFPNLAACAALDAEARRARLREIFEGLARDSTGTSNRITRVLLLEAPPSIDAGEITDKGSINQRAVLEVRAALVEALYAEPPDPRIIRSTP
ncbi:MAG: feruloyl-CoA synthase [Betaproteobacteria bacterium RIFCSPLOWO2_12_FULL_67_28]|nr:MAG: feruloyl-CoA synthase [Betaproteobacteria bacterium RIFCSPLOWO2_12_FULL_67_28]